MRDEEMVSGRIIAGKYRLEAAMARGGMGSVWRARHMTLDTPLAIKFIGAHALGSSVARKRFEREAKAAALLHSPHVVQIYDYGIEDDFPYLVMELLEGEDLGERLKQRPRLSPLETSGIVVQIARALRRAAEASIVHRDLKPGNVFLVRGEDEELVKVLDFGIAKVPRLRSDDDRTKTGTVLGSPRYMSPEQARGARHVDPRSDLWSLAVIAYRCITGVLPFRSNDICELIAKICSEDAPPPSSLRPDLGPELDAFFVRGLARDPDARFQTARELATTFAMAAGQSSSSARLQMRSCSDLALAELPAGVESKLVRPSAPAPARASTPSDCARTIVSERTAEGTTKVRRPFADSTTAREPSTSQIPPMPPVPGPHSGKPPTQPGAMSASQRAGAPAAPAVPAGRAWRTALATAVAVFLVGGLVLVPWSLVVGNARIPSASADVLPTSPPPPAPQPTLEPGRAAPTASTLPPAPRGAREPAPPSPRRSAEPRTIRSKKNEILGL